jgi:hypothetical protein
MQYNVNFLVKGKRLDNAMISIATKNWTNKEKTMEVARVIVGRLGITAKLNYKPDLYTVVEIFRDNEYKVVPHVYTY